MYDHKQSLKEVVRHVIYRCGLIEAWDKVRNRRGRYTDYMREGDIREVFSQIYSKNVWVEFKDQESLSGAGSTQYAADKIVRSLSAFLREVGCRRLVDIGCGDFNWMRAVEGDFDYLGIDVVPSVVEENTARFQNERRRFICLDASRNPIETGDVALCREVLFHLSFTDAKRLISNIKAAGFKYIILTSDKSIWFNSDIRNGDFRRINLQLAPFNFPAPHKELIDDRVAEGRVLAVWQTDSLLSQNVTIAT
ncbi:class I SAM-dependent methyltransferase [Bradyrhizobium sp. USDA 10063]